jgi:hypothetical protein
MIATGANRKQNDDCGAGMAVTVTTRRWPINRVIRMACTQARMMASEDKTTIRNALTFIETDMVMAAVIMETTDATVTVNSSRHIVNGFLQGYDQGYRSYRGSRNRRSGTYGVGRFKY